MKTNKRLATIFTVAAALAIGVSVYASEDTHSLSPDSASVEASGLDTVKYTTPDSVLTIETPDKDWKQVEDKYTWVTLTDGTDKITMLHYSNGETLPEITVADSSYEEVCQNIISTKNEVFIITGSVVDRADFEEVRDSVQSVVINQYDTKKAVENKANDSGNAQISDASKKTGDAEAENGGYTVTEDSFSVWVSSQQLNVRSSYSTESSVLGVVYYGDALKVTGIVKANGADAGWYRVDFGGSVGYVSSQYATKEGVSIANVGVSLTDEMVLLYELSGRGASYVYKATDGKWYDYSGRQYSPGSNGEWTLLPNGTIWTETAPESPADHAVDQANIVDQEGLNYGTLYLGEDGTWRNIAGGVYTPNGDNTWTGPDGTIWDTAS